MNLILIVPNPMECSIIQEMVNNVTYPTSEQQAMLMKSVIIYKYLHFQSKPLMNLKIFETVNSLMNDIN